MNLSTLETLSKILHADDDDTYDDVGIAFSDAVNEAANVTNFTHMMYQDSEGASIFGTSAGDCEYNFRARYCFSVRMLTNGLSPSNPPPTEILLSTVAMTAGINAFLDTI